MYSSGVLNTFTLLCNQPPGFFSSCKTETVHYIPVTYLITHASDRFGNRHVNQFSFVTFKGKYAGASGKFPILRRAIGRESLSPWTLSCAGVRLGHIAAGASLPPAWEVNTDEAKLCVPGKGAWSPCISRPWRLPCSPPVRSSSSGVNSWNQSTQITTPILTVILFILFLNDRTCFLVSYKFPSSFLDPPFPNFPKNYVSREYLTEEDSA